MAGWTLLVAVALVTSGCLSGDEAEDPTQQPGLEVGQPISALEGLDRAQAWANEIWTDDTQVLLASAIEAAPDSSALQSSQRSDGSYPIVADDALGDGRVALWIFQLWSPSTDQTRTVAVTQTDLDVFDPNGSTPRNPPTELGPWRLDSTEAAETAMREDGFETVARAEDGVIFYTLGPRGGRSVWQLRANSQVDDINAWGFIDAETGKSYTSDQDPGPRETHQVVGGNLTADAPQARHEVNVTGTRDTVDAGLTWHTASNTTSVGLTLRLEDSGTRLEPVEQDTGNGSLEMRWTNLTGAYELVVQAPEDGGWERVDYTLTQVILDDPNR